MSLVTKVRDKAGGLYGQAKDLYADSDAAQKASQQAGQLAGKVRDLTSKATSAVKDAQARGRGHK